MRLKLELGRRVQLQSMDSHCGDITIGLYEHADAKGLPCFTVHSYASRPGAPERIAFLAGAMIKLGGMAAVSGSLSQLRWPCGDRHLTATKRLFLEACKLPNSGDLAERPLFMVDAKLGGTVAVEPKGGGRYEIVAEANGADHQARLKAICAGYLKLAEMERWEQSETGIRFACGTPHDPLMRLLLFRSLNVRAVLREQEMMATRGMLTAPGAQAPAP